SWGHLGIAGRALVLGAVTAAILGVPALLLRRRLRSTAESVAGLGLALTVLDAYALHEAGLPGTDGTGYAAVASAVLAVAWAAIALGAAWLAATPRLAKGAATAGGLLVVAGLGGVLRVSLPGEWTVPAYLACGVALLAVAPGPLPEPVRRGVAWASGTVQALA